MCESVPTENDAKLITAAPEMLNLLKEINEIKTTSMFHARMKELLETKINK